MIKLEIQSVHDLKDNSYGLSLSDQYWIHPITADICWEDINFFTNDFEYLDFVDAVFSSSSHIHKTLRASPNYATDGMVKKAWIIEENGERTLLKGGYRKSRQEPFNELLASMLCECLSFDHVPYHLKKIDNQIVSACPTFTNENTELIPAVDIFNLEKKSNSINDYNFYISILEQHGIHDARRQLENMIVLDFLMLNENRHLRNFGILRDVNTSAWLKVAPIYDTGQSLLSQSELSEMNFHESFGKFFSNTQMPFDKIIQHVSDLSRFEFENLYDVLKEWENEVEKFNKDGQHSKERLNKIVEGMKMRIQKLLALKKTSM